MAINTMHDISKSIELFLNAISNLDTWTSSSITSKRTSHQTSTAN